MGKEKRKRAESEKRLPFIVLSLSRSPSSISVRSSHLRASQRCPRRDQNEHRQGPGAPIGVLPGRAAGEAAACRRRLHVVSPAPPRLEARIKS